MKPTLLLTLVMLFAFASCGGDNKSSNSNTGYFTNNLSTQEGFFNFQTRSLTVNGQQVPLMDAQSIQIVNRALQAAEYGRVQPTMLNNNGGYGYRARVTAYLAGNGYSGGYNSGYSSGYNMGYPPTYGNVQSGYGNNYGSGQVIISSIQFY